MARKSVLIAGGILTITALVLGCASVRGPDVSRLQNEMSRSLQATEDVLQKTHADYNEKSRLIDNLSKADTPEYRASELELKQQLTAMKLTLEQVDEQHKVMRAANSEMASVAYSAANTETGDNPNANKANELMSKFKASTDAMNAALLNYSRESNRLTDLVAQKRLFVSFDVTAFKRRLEQTIKTAQTNRETMQRELTRGQQLVNHAPGSEAVRNRSLLLVEMGQIAQEYTTRAQGLAQLAQDMDAISMGGAQISSLDDRWPKAQKISDELDRAILDLKDGFSKFGQKLDKSRTAK